jgi:hypothetical protein
MLVTVCSLKGSPGVTTLATALGACWPAVDNPILAEADPAGGDLMARFRLNDTPGLVTLAVAARRSTDPGLLGQHTQQLPGGLRVVVGPVGAEQAHSALAVFASNGFSPFRRAADQSGTTVIVDCGRVDPRSQALPIIRSSDAMLLLARPNDEELAHVALKLQEAQRWSRRPCLILVGDGYPTRDVSQALGIPVMGRVPRDDKGTAVLSGRSNIRHDPARSRLGRTASRIATLTFAHWRASNSKETRPWVRQQPIAASGTPTSGVALQLVGPPTRNGTSA